MSRRLTRLEKKRPIALLRLGMDLLGRMDDRRFIKPRVLGGSAISPHSQALNMLADRGLVERRKLHALDCSVYQCGRSLTARCECGGSVTYRRTPAGRAAIATA